MNKSSSGKNYIFRHEIASNEEGYRPIQIRINAPKVENQTPTLITLSSGRFFYPFSILDLDNIIRELLFVRELINNKSVEQQDNKC